MVILKTENLNLIYNQNEPNEVHALKNINFEIHKGDLIALTGSSGSGKSSFLHVIGAMQTPTSGKISLLNKNLEKLNRMQLSRIRRENIGFTFQSFALLKHLTSLENVMIPLYPTNPKWLKSRALELLSKVGLENRINHFPTQLSGGEKQRVAIARSLINNPSIVLGDEITGNLDSVTGSDIFSLIEDLNKSEEITFVIVTHDLKIAKRCKKQFEITDGSIEPQL